MASIDFPSNPTTGQTYTFNSIVYTFTSQGVWQPGTVSPSQIGPTGPTGVTGNTGPAQSSILNTLTPSGVATVDDTTSFTSAYDSYLIEFVNVVPATDGTFLLMQLYTSGVLRTTGYHQIAAGGFASGFNGTGSAVELDGSTVGIPIGPATNADFTPVGNTAGVGVSGHLILHGVNSANAKSAAGSCIWRAITSAAGYMDTAVFGGFYGGDTNVVTGIRLKFLTGNITSGTIRIYALTGTQGPTGPTGATGTAGAATNTGATGPAGTAIRSIGLALDGGGVAITTGVKSDLYIPYSCTITKMDLFADQSGSIVLDIWKDTTANYPPTVAKTITASALPTLSSAIDTQDSTLTGWTKSITAGDTLRFNVNSCTTITRVCMILEVSVP